MVEKMVDKRLLLFQVLLSKMNPNFVKTEFRNG